MPDPWIWAKIIPSAPEQDWSDAVAARVHDPLWFLARQWQLGEHQGENATTPVWSMVHASQRPVTYAETSADRAATPSEALVESEANDWWTMGRRVRIGELIALDHPVIRTTSSLLFTAPPPPYESFLGKPDGLAIALNLPAGVTLSDYAEIPPETIPAWDSRQLIYTDGADASFTSSSVELRVDRHRGGRLDWYSVDASGVPADPPDKITHSVIPARLEYPGRPLTTVWQIENEQLDLGGTAPDSAHTATTLMTEMYHSTSDEWFVVPVMGAANTILAIDGITVTDSFGRTYATADFAGDDPAWPRLKAPEGWTLFETVGLDPAALLLWNVAEIPLESVTIEKVQFGLDEQGNLVWAVERVLEGKAARHTAEATGKPFNAASTVADKTVQTAYAYVPGEGAAEHWIPYTGPTESSGDDDTSLVQRRLTDFSRAAPDPLPPAVAHVLLADKGTHQIDRWAIPTAGLEVERRWQLARDITGRPVLWIQRQRRPLLSAPARQLRFDVLRETTAPEHG